MNQEDIIKELSKKYKLPRYAIKQIIDIPFKMMSEVFYKRELKTFIIPRLGKFVISPKKQKFIQENILPQMLEKDKRVSAEWKIINDETKAKKQALKDGDQTGTEGVG